MVGSFISYCSSLGWARWGGAEAGIEPGACCTFPTADSPSRTSLTLLVGLGAGAPPASTIARGVEGCVAADGCQRSWTVCEVAISVSDPYAESPMRKL